MADKNSCPSKALLEQFVMGQLPSVEVEQWAGHVEQCGECIKTLDGLKAEDTVIDALKHPGNAAEVREHERVQNLIGELSGWNEATVEPTFLSGEPASAPGDTQEACDFLGPAQSPDELGRLGPYRVLKVLGAGGMGVVFQAEDPLLERPVALKAMLPALAASATAKQRFIREARSAAALKHDHIVTIYQVGEDRGVPFLAMEFLEGETLEQRLDRERTLTIAEVARIGREIAEGLAVAHKRGLIHRDVKPANVWLESASDRPATGGRAKILDFGLARAANDDAHLTSQGAIVGTPAYMAPEQATGDKVDSRSDLFSLGCVLYRMCTGQAPFRGKDAVSTLLAVAGQQPPRPMDVNPAVPAPLSEIVMQLLAKQPDERPQSAQVVVEALLTLASVQQSASTNLENGVSTVVKDIPAHATHGAKATKKVVAAKPGKEKQPPWKNRPALTAAAFLGVLILAGIIISLTTKDGTLIVEVDQPDAIVQVLDLEGKVEISQKGGAGKVSIGVDPGKHRLKVEKDGFAVFGQEFEMGTGGKKTITAKLEPNKLTETKAIKTPAPSVTKVQPPTTSPTAASVTPLANINDPAFQQWMKDARAMSAEEQVKAVSRKLVELNPGFDGRAQNVTWNGPPKIEAGVVTEMGFHAAKVADLSPVRGLAGLKVLSLSGGSTTAQETQMMFELSPLKGMALDSLTCSDLAVTDLSPLTGMPLTKLGFFRTPVSNLSPLRGMQLTELDCSGTNVSDLLPLQGMKLSNLRCFHTNISDLSPLEGMPLTYLNCGTTRVSNLSPLRGAPLNELSIPGTPVSDLSPLEECKSLQKLKITNTKVTPAGVAALQIALPNCKITWDDPAKVTGLPAIAPPIADPFDRFRREDISPYELKVAGLGDAADAPPELVGIIGDSRFRHFDPTRGIPAFSPDGKKLALGSWFGPVHLWDVATGQMEWRERSGPEAPGSTCVAFSPDGTRVAHGAQWHNHVILLDAATGDRVGEFLVSQEKGNWLKSLAFTRDGKKLAGSGNFKEVILWDVATGNEIRRYTGHTDRFVNSLSLSPDDKLLVTAGSDKTVRVWDLETSQELRQLQGIAESVRDVVFLPDGRRVLVGFDSETSRAGVWEVSTGARLLELPARSCVAASSDGKHWAAWDDSKGPGKCEIVWFDAASGNKLRTSRMMQDSVTRLAFSPDGNLLASGSYLDHAVRLWSSATGQEVTATDRAGRVDSLAVSGDGGRLAWRAQTLADNVALVWDVAQDKPIFETHGLNISEAGVDLSRDGQWLSTGEVGSTSGMPRVLDLAGGKELWVTGPVNRGYVTTFGPQGTQLAVVRAGVEVWDVKQGKKLHRFDKHTQHITALDWCAAKNWIASAISSKDVAEIKIWDAATGAEVLQLQDPTKDVWSLCFSPDGSRLAVACGTLARGAVYDLATGKRLFFTSSEGVSNNLKHAQQFSPDSRTLAVGTPTGQLSLRDATTGETRQQWQLPGAVSSLAFAPDGRHLLVGLGNSTIYVLRLSQSSFDRFRREEISPYELKAAGMGDAAQAPAELVGILGDSRFRHFDSSPSVAFTPDGKKLASCERYGPVVLWDVATGETQWRVLPGFNCTCAVLSPDGTHLAVAGPNHTQVVLLDATNGKKVCEFLVSKEQDKGITSLAFTHDGKQLVGSGQPKEVFLWDVATGHEIRQFVGHTDRYVDALSLSPDDKLLVTGGKDKTVRVWDVATGQELRQLQGIPAQVVDVAFLPDGQRVLLGFGIGNNRAGVWDVSTGTRLLELPARTCVAASSDGKYWAACDDSKGYGKCEIVWFDATTGKKLRASPMMHEAVNRLAFSPDGELLASAGKLDHAVRLWSTATGKEVTGDHRGGAIQSLAVSSDGGRLGWRAETLADSMALVWDVAQGKPIFERHGLGIGPLGISPDGQWLSTGEIGSTGMPRLWDLTHGKELRSTAPMPGWHLTALGRQETQAAVVAQSKNVDIWDVKQGKKLVRFDKHTKNISALDWCAAKNWIASATLDLEVPEIKIWDAATGAEVLQLQDQTKNVVSLCFSPDGSRLAVGAGSYDNGAVYDLATGKRLFVTRGDGGYKHAKRFSPDSRTLAVGTPLGQLTLRDATTGETRRQWQLAGAVTSLAFAPDGRHLLVGMGNSTIYVMRLGDESLANVGAKLNATQPNASQSATPSKPITKSNDPAKPTTP